MHCTANPINGRNQKNSSKNLNLHEDECDANGSMAGSKPTPQRI
jgi:hypothetical protein